MFLTGNRRIQILNDVGDWLLTIDGKVITGNISFMYPLGLALDHQGNIYLAESDSIKVVTKEGVYVRTYGGPGAPRPWGIAIDNEGNALIIDSICLSIFNHHGNKIHIVWNLQNSGMALDPRDGSVYVVDYGANAVPKYSDI